MKATEADETASGPFAQISARTAAKCPQLPKLRTSMTTQQGVRIEGRSRATVVPHSGVNHGQRRSVAVEMRR